jgi:hypothetical protein
MDKVDTKGTVITPHSSRSSCPELICPLGSISFNAYACDAFVQTVVVLDIIMLIWCALHFMWLHTMAQFPWRYRNIHQVVKHHLSGTIFSCFTVDTAGGVTDSSTEMRTVFDGEDGGSNNNSMLLIYCPMCRIPLTKRLAHGKVCPNCSVIRVASFPLLVGLSTTFGSLFCAFFLTMRSDFDIPFKIALLTLRISSFVLYYAYAIQSLKKAKSDATMHLGLLVLLIRHRFKDIQCLNVPGVIDLIPGFYREKPTVSLGDDMSNTSISQGYLVPQELTTAVPHAFRAAIRNIITPPVWSADEISTSDAEFIMWWEKPSMKQVMLEHRHLLHGSASLTLIFITLILIGIGADIPLHDHVGRGTFLALGLTGVVVFTTIFALVLASCERMHIVTTQRMITLSMGVLGAIYMSATDLKDVCCAAILEYHEYGDMRIVSFQHPRVANRRLPPLPTSRFVCVDDVFGLIMTLKQHAPPLNNEHWKGYMETIRQEYRSGMFAAMIFMQGLSLLYYYEIIPVFPLSWCFLSSISLFISCLCRGSRIHLITTHIVKSEKPWSLWRLPQWKVKRPVVIELSRPETTTL